MRFRTLLLRENRVREFQGLCERRYRRLFGMVKRLLIYPGLLAAVLFTLLRLLFMI